MIEVVVILIFYAILVVVAVGLYFLPAILAFRRDHQHRWLILAVNALFGATIIGWLGALIWTLAFDGNGLIGNRTFNVKLVEDRRAYFHGPEAPSYAPLSKQLEGFRVLADLYKSGAIDQVDYDRLRSSLVERITGGP